AADRDPPTAAGPVGSPAAVESLLAPPVAQGPKRPARYGLSIQFETLDGVHELARLVESTVWVNDAHPACRRASGSGCEGYHVALAVARGLAPLGVEEKEERAFVTAFMERGGGAVAENGHKGRS